MSTNVLSAGMWSVVKMLIYCPSVACDEYFSRTLPKVSFDWEKKFLTLIKKQTTTLPDASVFHDCMIIFYKIALQSRLIDLSWIRINRIIAMNN